MKYPTYHYPPGRFIRAALDLILGRPRDLQEDARACIKHMRADLKVLGTENIPQQGACVFTINHYHRPGLGAQWIALAVSALVPLNIRWAVTGELMCQGKWYAPFASRASRVFLKRLADIYGMTTMPPMPPRPKDVAARAASVRAILDYVSRTKNPVLGISPEGHNPPGGCLSRPSAGFGRFALLLAKAGIRFIPVGGYELDGIFHVHFGEKYELRLESHTCTGRFTRQIKSRYRSSDHKDELATQIVMEKISGVLPTHLRGEFA